MEIATDQNKTLYISLVLGLAGAITHQLKQYVQALSDKAQPLGALIYWTKNWPQTCLSVIGTIVVMALAAYAGDLNPVSAYLSGLAGNSAAELIGSRTPTS